MAAEFTSAATQRCILAIQTSPGEFIQSIRSRGK